MTDKSTPRTGMYMLERGGLTPNPEQGGLPVDRFDYCPNCEREVPVDSEGLCMHCFTPVPVGEADS